MYKNVKNGYCEFDFSGTLMDEVFFLISQILKDNESTGECYRPKLKVDNTF